MPLSRSCDAIDIDTGDVSGSAVDKKGVSIERARKGQDMLTFLVWWTSAAIIVGSGVTAWFVHLNFRAH